MARHRNVAREELQGYLAALPQPKPKSAVRHDRAAAIRVALATAWAARLDEAGWRAMVLAEARRCVPADDGNAVLRAVDDAFEVLDSYVTFSQARGIVALEHALNPEAVSRWDALHEEYIDDWDGDQRRWRRRVETVRKELQARAQKEATCPTAKVA